MCAPVCQQALDNGHLTSTTTTTTTTSYSTFSIASLIGHHQVNDDNTTLISRISDSETTVRDHPGRGIDSGEDCSSAVSPCTTTTTTSLPADAVVSDDDASGG